MTERSASAKFDKTLDKTLGGGSRHTAETSPFAAGEALRDRALAVARAPERFAFAVQQPDAAPATIRIRPMSIPFVMTEIVDPIVIAGTIDGAPYSLATGSSQLALWIERSEPLVFWDELDERRRAEVLEYLGAFFIDSLECRSGKRITLTRVKKDGPTAPAPNFAFALNIDGLRLFAAGRFDARTLLGLATWASQLQRQGLEGLSVFVAIRRGMCIVTADECARLKVGDGLVFDPIEHDMAFAVIGERLAAPCRLEATRAILLARPQDHFVGPMRHWMNSDTETGDAETWRFAEAPTDGAIGTIPVKIVFDIGRFSIPIRDVAAIQEGHIFPLDRFPRGLVEVVAHGKIIGRGEIIEHDALYAVRITSLVA